MEDCKITVAKNQNGIGEDAWTAGVVIRMAPGCTSELRANGKSPAAARQSLHQHIGHMLVALSTIQTEIGNRNH